MRVSQLTQRVGYRKRYACASINLSQFLDKPFVATMPNFCAAQGDCEWHGKVVRQKLGGMAIRVGKVRVDVIKAEFPLEPFNGEITAQRHEGAVPLFKYAGQAEESGGINGDALLHLDAWDYRAKTRFEATDKPVERRPGLGGYDDNRQMLRHAKHAFANEHARVGVVGRGEQAGEDEQTGADCHDSYNITWP